MTASDLLLVNHQGEIVGGGKPERQMYNSAAFVIHSAIHAARPDVHSAVHAHSPAGKAFATLGRELPFYTQDSATFWGDIGLYAKHGGVVLGFKESQEIVEHLGQGKALVMQNHGIMSVGGSIESAVAWFYLWVTSCERTIVMTD
jgi:ribulose-5-phosphate 4-epimerase/fuculose-1-phosphate aldolase